VVNDQTIRLEGKIALVGADSNRHAANRLRQEWSALDLFEAGAIPENTPSIRLAGDATLPEGGFALSIDDTGGAPVVDIAGGPFSGVIYGVEELVQRWGTQVGSGVELTSGSTQQAPGLPYRA
jgi:hypothetical protein